MTSPGTSSSGGFPTVFGRGLVAQLRDFAPRPYLVVTMADLWPRFEAKFDLGLGGVHLVTTLDLDELEGALAGLPGFGSVIGLGGGQALDVAKFFAWRTRRPLFQVPTATTVNAPFGHRAGVRTNGTVRYLGWAVPQAVYIDFDVIQSAPPALNRSGVGDVLCYHTAQADWRLAADEGRVEARWPYDEELVTQARQRLDSVMSHLDDIREVNETGIRTLVEAHRWGGTTFHDSGWNPRHIEGVEHFFFYNLERLTGRHFIHGQPVGLGICFGAALQDNEPGAMVAAIRRAGVDIRPEAMGVTWDDAAEAMRTLSAFVRQAGLWYSVADARPVTEALIDDVRQQITAAFGAWEGQAAPA